ncbi:MAG: hypothetical protein HFACDABA_00881 [Anaerolineales bacterium]|nr:hypothetical protein [Anaerolineales bacterium]
MPNKHTFTATILNAGGGGAYLEVPFDVEKAFGAKSRWRGRDTSRAPC